MTKERGINNQNLKMQNRALLLKLIATGQCASRIELARESRLTKMSVSNIVSEFIEQGLVEETHTGVSQNVGRCPIILDITANAPKVAGLLIGRERCSGVICDLKLNVIDKKTIDIEKKSQEGLLETVYSLLDDILKDKRDVYGIGIGSIGPLDVENGIILNPPNFYGITNIPIVELLKERYQMPVYMGSQYNNAALAEKYYGNGKEYRDFMFLGITNGIGSGVIMDGQLMCNSTSLTSEVGHISIDYQGNYCDCGNRGCLETYAGANVICRRLAKVTGRIQSFEGYCQDSGDPVIDRVLTEMIEMLGYGLVACINILNPQVIMMGDEGVFLPERYLRQLEAHINQYKLSKSYNYVKVIKPCFHKDAQLIGSAVCLLEQIFQGNLLINV